MQKTLFFRLGLSYIDFAAIVWKFGVDWRLKGADLLRLADRVFPHRNSVLGGATEEALRVQVDTLFFCDYWPCEASGDLLGGNRQLRPAELFHLLDAVVTIVKWLVFIENMIFFAPAAGLCRGGDLLVLAAGVRGLLPYAES